MKSRFIQLQRVVLFLTVAVLQSQVLQAQFRHSLGANAVEVGAGMSLQTRQCQAAYTVFFSSSLYGKLSLFALTGEDKGYRFQSLGSSVTLQTKLLEVNEEFYVNAKAGMLVTYDQLRDPIQVTSPDEGPQVLAAERYGTWKGGPVVGLESETYLVYRVAMLTSVSYARLLGGEAFGKNRLYLTFGFRYEF